MNALGVPLAERLAGGVWGHLVGDAVGVPYEFLEPSAVGVVEMRGGGQWGQPAGTWSDDGALMLALLDSLLTVGFDTHDQGRRALAWADGTAYTPDGDGRFDIGGATRRALERVRAGVDAEAAGGTGERDQGNGSLMRILPIALVEREVPDAALVDHAHRASAVTHGHPVAQATCALYCLVARGLLRGAEPGSAMTQARATLRVRYADDELRQGALDVVEAHAGRSGSGYVVDAFWSAWDAFAGADSYRTTIERAIRYGHDTDTTACIAGGLAGIRFGIGGIPAEWLDRMRGQDVVEPLVERLVDGLDGALQDAFGSLEVLASFADDFAQPPGPFGAWRGGERLADDTITMPWVEYADWIMRFVRACAGAGWVRPDVDWMRWVSTPEAERLRSDPAVLAQASARDLACLLTAIIRSDRFSEGSLLGACESGLVERIVGRAVELQRVGHAGR